MARQRKEDDLKFVITGAAGHVSKPLTELLVRNGRAVTVVGRSHENLKGLVDQGAKAAVGNMLDVLFLSRIFEGAAGVYLMLPPMWDADDQKQLSKTYAEGFVSAIKAAGVKNAVFLSSWGAHRLHDAGAISGMGLAEQILDKLDGVNVLHLRAGYFYSNLFLSLELVRREGRLGNMFQVPVGDFAVVDPNDVAKAAAHALETRSFKGHSHRYVISDLTGTDEIASLIGKEIGIRDLKWIKFSAADFKKVLIGFGFAEGAVDSYVEMFTAMDRGLLIEHIKAVRPEIGGVTIEEFAKQFAVAYERA
jgi:uncharacterized protein YbjT (DUF2867 family)